MNHERALAAAYHLEALMELTGAALNEDAASEPSADPLQEAYGRYRDYMRSFQHTRPTWLVATASDRLLGRLISLPSDGEEFDEGSNHPTTFGDLLEQREKSAGATPATTFANDRTTLRKFMRHIRQSDASPIHPYLTTQFDAQAESFLRTVGLGTRASHRSRLNAWRTTALNLVSATRGRKPLYHALSEHFGDVEAADYKARVAAAANAAHMSVKQLEGWIGGKPCQANLPKTREKLAHIERHLALTPGSLLSLATKRRAVTPRVASGDGGGEPSHAKSFDAEVLKVLWAVTIVPSPPPARIASFLEDLVNFKTGGEPILDASGEMLFDRPDARSGWSEATGKKVCSELLLMVAWLMLSPSSADARARIATAKLNTKPSGEFLECLVPMFQGHGLAAEDVRVTDLFNPALVSRYLAWKTKRRSGKVTDGHAIFLKDILALLSPKYGFVTQRPEIAWDTPQLGFLPLLQGNKEFPESYLAQKKGWAERCARFHEQIASIKARVSKQISEAADDRGPKHALRSITKLKDPVSVLLRLIESHAANQPSNSLTDPEARSRAIWLRDQVLLRLVLSNPLRNRNIREMTWQPDGSGNLYQEGATWKLRFSAGQMKGRTRYDVEVDPALAPLLERYLKSKAGHGRDTLVQVGAPHKNCVFLTKNGTPFTSAQLLSQRFEQLTFGYLDELPGTVTESFRSHAWRHIVATGYIKATGDFLTAALILNDRLATVLKHYAHLVPQDGFEKYGKWLQARAARVGRRS